MRPLGIILAVIIGVGALVGTVWVARYSSWATPTPPRPLMTWEKTAEVPPVKAPEKKEDAKPEVKDPAVETPPAIADKPPFPRVLTGERVFDFGRMGVNEEKRHKFRIENKGQAPLLLAKGPSTCKCTVSSLASHQVPPGGFAEIELSWTPREPKSDFEQSAKIWTNDPDAKEIQFHVNGSVVEQFRVLPNHNWYAGVVTDAQDGRFTGQVLSDTDANFQILSVDSNTPPLLNVTYTPLLLPELRREKAVAGYDVTVTVKPAVPMGTFRSHLKVKTNLEGGKTIDIDVTARRSGPIVFLPPIGKATWNHERLKLHMGRFDHAQGNKVILPVLILNQKEPFKIVETISDVDFVKVHVEPNPQIGGDSQQGLRLVFEIPPGSPAITRVEPDEVKVKLKTNHPKLPELDFKLEFISQ